MARLRVEEMFHDFYGPNLAKPPGRRSVRAGAPVLASDAERDGTVEQLRTAQVEGRLAIEGFDERVDRALRAVHRYELDRLTADLPQRPVRRSDAPSGALAWPWVALISLVMFAIPFGGLVVMFGVIWPSAPGWVGGVGGIVCVVAWLSLAFLTTTRSQKR